MFKSKTVLVIGAGAGQEIGLPIGADLSVQVGRKLNFVPDSFGVVSSGDPEIRQTLLNQTGKMAVDINTFYSAGRQIAQGIQYSRSIDEFINKHKDDNAIQLCAKLAIAQAIVDAERNSAIFVDHAKMATSFAREKQVQSSWLLEFVRILHDGLAKADINKILDSLTIINFNYDRCIEQLLYYTLQFSYGATAQQAANALVGASGSNLTLESRMGFPSDLPNVVVGFQAAISRFVAEANDDPKPFTWLADPNKSIVAVRRGYQVLDSIH